MKAIEYPRQLNRPSYILWRYTYDDVKGGGYVFLSSQAPNILHEFYPSWVGMVLVAIFLAYRGCVIALKPRGWDVHVVKSLLQPLVLSAGHTLRRCIIVDRLPERKRSMWASIAIWRK